MQKCCTIVIQLTASILFSPQTLYIFPAGEKHVLCLSGNGWEKECANLCPESPGQRLCLMEAALVHGGQAAAASAQQF